MPFAATTWVFLEYTGKLKMQSQRRLPIFFFSFPLQTKHLSHLIKKKKKKKAYNTELNKKKTTTASHLLGFSMLKITVKFQESKKLVHK